jgi:hypothetical protein
MPDSANGAQGDVECGHPQPEGLRRLRLNANLRVRLDLLRWNGGFNRKVRQLELAVFSFFDRSAAFFTPLASRLSPLASRLACHEGQTTIICDRLTDHP